MEITDVGGEKQLCDYLEKQLQSPEPLPERLRRFRSHLPFLYWAAEDNRKEGMKRQYRRFGVGAAALAFRPGDSIYWPDQSMVLTGFNSKEHQGGPKCCAERRLFEDATRRDVVQIVGIVVVGPYQPDDTSGHECTTLHPCHDCRTMMANHPLAWTGMPIMTALPPPCDRPTPGWEPEREWHTLGQLLHIHARPAA